LLGVITRRALVALLCLAALPGSAQESKVRRIGFLGLTPSRAAVSVARVEALRTGLREHGYVEGKNIALEFRWADGDYERLPGLAEELVQAKVDLIVTYATPGAIAAKKATQTIPIVLASVGDPLSTGVVPNLAHPGSNITGLALFTPEEIAKRLELMKDVFPKIRRVGVLVNPGNPLYTKATVPFVRQAASRLSLDCHIIDVRSVADFEPAFAAMAGARDEAVVLFEDPLFSGEASKLAALAVRHRLPAVGQVVFADAGGLIGNGANQLELFRRAAGYIDRIFKGARPGDLPIEQASRFELVVNLNTATALGLTLPKSLVGRADRIIE